MTSNDYKTTRITLLRHGKPEGEHCLRGHTDFPLQAEGWEQMRQAIANVPHQFDHIITSPLSRCSHFAHELANQRQISISEWDCFKEYHFGDWDGMLHSDVSEQYPELSKAFWMDPGNNTPPNGEPMHQFAERIQTGWERLINQHQGQHILLVCHAGIMKERINRFLIGEQTRQSYPFFTTLNLPYAALVDVTVFSDNAGKHLAQVSWPTHYDENDIAQHFQTRQTTSEA